MFLDPPIIGSLILYENSNLKCLLIPLSDSLRWLQFNFNPIITWRKYCLLWYSFPMLYMLLCGILILLYFLIVAYSEQKKTTLWYLSSIHRSNVLNASWNRLPYIPTLFTKKTHQGSRHSLHVIISQYLNPKKKNTPLFVKLYMYYTSSVIWPQFVCGIIFSICWYIWICTYKVRKNVCTAFSNNCTSFEYFCVSVRSCNFLILSFEKLDWFIYLNLP